MDLIAIIGKLINKQDLTSNERRFLLDFFASIDKQKITRLSQITFNAGDIVAGRFIAPSPTSKSTEPTDATFTGSFMSGVGEAFGSDTYNTGGVALGILQWGASQTDGKLYAGGGDVIIDANGITLANGAEWFVFEDAQGNTNTIYITAVGDNALSLVNVSTGGAIKFTIELTDATTPYVKWHEDLSNSNMAELQINAGATAPTVVVIGGDNNAEPNAGVVIYANIDGKETVFNANSYDIDHRIEGATDVNLVTIDGGNDNVTVGGTSASGHKFAVDGIAKVRDASDNTAILLSNAAGTATVINEQGADSDTRIEGDTDANLVFVDASTDRVGIGTATPTAKLNVEGSVIINDNSADVDVRIEGNGDANLVVVDGGLDAVAMGGAADGNYKLKVYGNLAVDDDIDAGGNLDVGGSAEITGNVTISSGSFFKIGTTDILAGWIPQSATWTRTGNHTFTMAGDTTQDYRKGTKVRYKDGGSYEYGVVASSVFGAVTTVTLITNTDYLMAAATITDTYISYIDNPSAWPGWFNFDAAPTGFSAVPATPIYRWIAKGNYITLVYSELNNGTSNATTFTASAPVAAANISGASYTVALGTTVDNTVIQTTPGRAVLPAGTATITLREDSANGAWTNSGGKRATFVINYEF